MSAEKPANSRGWRFLVTAGTILLMCLTVSAAGEDTDVVVFANGDRLTGEIKQLERGRLAFKTDATGTIQIEWNDLVSITSAEHFEVEVESGERFFGALVSTEEPGRLVVADDEDSVSLELSSVVRLTPIEETFWEQIDGHLDLGFSFTEADDRTQFSIGLEARHVKRSLMRKVALNSVLATQSGVDATNRHDLNFTAGRQLRPKRLLVGLASFQHNEEVGIDLRALVGGAHGWQVVQTNSNLLTLFAGISYNHEILAGAESSRDSAEGLLGLQYESFKYDYPERDISVALNVFPGLTESGRVRAELNAKLRWEIVDDFFVSLTALESYDTDPPIEGASKSDLSLITSLGWSF